MTTIAEKLLSIANSKAAIKDAIEAKGVTVGSVPFADYATKVGQISGSSSDWVRPSDWLALPVLTDADQKFVGLHTVEEDASFLALSATGAYTVDWGDGTVQNFASGVVAEHEYNYATYDVAGATLCSRGYKQVVVVVTPQAGQTLTSLDFQRRHSALSVAYASGFLDIAIAGASLTSLTLGGSTIRVALLEQAKLFANAITSFLSTFDGCRRLQSIPVLNTAAGTNFGSMFANCSSLRTIPLIDTSLGTNFSSMFSACVSLQTIPALNTAAGTNFGSMFSGCVSLQSIPLINTAAGTNFTSMFNTCSSLRTIPALSLGGAVGATSYNLILSGANALSDINVTAIKFNFNISNCKLSAARLNELFTNLATVTGQTLTITGNYGAATCNRSIAIAKGWSVP